MKARNTLNLIAARIVSGASAARRIARSWLGIGPPPSQTPAPRRDLKEVALEYCRTHPEARASIIAAGRRLEAADDVQGDERPHRFTSAAPWGRCINCDVTREKSTSPVCARHKSAADIMAVIRDEERRFEKTLARAENIAASLNVAALTGAELAMIHHTHGIDPSMLESALGNILPQRLHDEYEAAYEEHCKKGGRGLVKAILVAKTA